MGGTASIAAVKYIYMYVCVGGGEEGKGRVCGCDCMGEEGSVWVGKP